MDKKLVCGLLASTVFICLAILSWAATVPKEAQRHFDRGMAAVEMAKSPDDYAAAIKEFEQAIRFAPDWPDVYYNLGMVQEKAGKYRDAITSLRQYLQLVPNASDATTVKSLINKLEYKAEPVLAVAKGFMGIPWGASTQQIIKTMSEQGYRQLTGTKPGKLAFRGAFAEVPCELEFYLIANSFYSGSADHCAIGPYRVGPQRYFEQVVKMLSEKYGPPQNHDYFGASAEKEKEIEAGGAAIICAFAEWDLVDSRTSDKYSVDVVLWRAWYADGTLNYDVSISYKADSLWERLRKKDF
ncbi:MAG: tetratricopeptide repeat protein [Methanosarcinales archaeon]|nr:MAG: tetratricopeptide repeat protein [Methanosarcinales archaeon]